MLLMAQVAGGTVTRPTKKQQTTTTTFTKKPIKQTKKAEAAGYDVKFTCNVPQASLSIDGTVNGTASGVRFLKTGSHNIQLMADGYEPLSDKIVVNSSSTSFVFTMKQSEETISPVLQALINNMVRIEGGTYTMGATYEQDKDAEEDEKPIHQITLEDFSIGKYEVTQEEWQTVMGNNPSFFKGTKRPVEQVSWEDCQAFIRKLNQLTGKRFRLPTEAEWEYAARGGKHSLGYKYSGSDDIEHVAWYGDNSGNETHSVGEKQPNEIGLYDMSGNVWEWCQDWFGRYASNSQSNPIGASRGHYRVNRGGSWFSLSKYCRSSYRVSDTPSNRHYYLGLRLAL